MPNRDRKICKKHIRYSAGIAAKEIIKMKPKHGYHLAIEACNVCQCFHIVSRENRPELKPGKEELIATQAW